ncbi:MAG TPA: hypothetical protein VHB78_14260 [Vicinamibacterales bacterium]|jgi:hypothetical protein|nr:hypothetical protein [Vicinamibacterales bacterium]
MSWRLFIGAAILGGAIVIKAGAPLLSVAAGIALAAWLNRLRLSARGSAGGPRS